MRLCVGLADEGTAERELLSLHTWLLAEPAARRHARPVLDTAGSPQAGAQGDMIDLVSLVVNSGFSAASFALSLAAWRATRPGQPVVTVERPDGARITIADSSPEETRRLLESLTDDGTGGRDDLPDSRDGRTDGQGGGDGRGAPA
ncbi:hypothetical protein ACFTTN_02575 [Streptomyces niveus]|uniref:effector-associated constant component EACC1 n=1 Tax=Streptomyces niveus TaxID=193462 RepID=UPI00362FF690